jgi:zinc finger SWIM domain-containing protein 3
MEKFVKVIPELGLRFRNPDESWQFWVAYGGRMGFDVRKMYINVSTFDSKVTSCRYVCSNESHRRKGQTDHVTKCFRARTDCRARMTLTLDRGHDNYEVTVIVLEHNHLLHFYQKLAMEVF